MVNRAKSLHCPCRGRPRVMSCDPHMNMNLHLSALESTSCPSRAPFSQRPRCVHQALLSVHADPSHQSRMSRRRSSHQRWQAARRRTAVPPLNLPRLDLQDKASIRRHQNTRRHRVAAVASFGWSLAHRRPSRFPQSLFLGNYSCPVSCCYC